MANVSSTPVAARVAGLILTAFGGLTLLAMLETASGVTPPYSILDYEISMGLILLGIALVMGSRWAGLIAIVSASTGLVLGVVATFSESDVAIPGSNLIVGLLFIAPSVVVLKALLTTRARGWLRGRPPRREP